MKRFSVCIVLLSVIMFLVPNAIATVLTFDDLTPVVQFGTIHDGYGELDWSNMNYRNGNYIDAPNTGYYTGLVSGDYVAYNSSGAVASASNGTFDFTGAYLTAAWRDELQINVVGMQGAFVAFDQTVEVNTSGPTWFGFNYEGIDELIFTSYGGAQNPDFTAGSGAHFAMDNFTYNAVPEPSTLLLFGTGIIGIGVFRRKFKV
jgi:hypothetical protein